MLNRIYQNKRTRKQAKITGIEPGWIRVEYFQSKRTFKRTNWYKMEDFNRMFKRIK